MSEDLKADIVRLQERLGSVQAATDKAHSRVDGLQKEVKDELHEIAADVKILLANMHTQKGSKATWLLVGTLGAALVGALAKIFIH